MDLMHRPTGERDLAECLAILQDGFSYPNALRERLPAIAARLLAEGAMNSAVLEDMDQPAGQRLLQFGASVFLSDAFVREAEAGMMPHLSVQVVAAIIKGRSPVLTLPEIRAANARDGLNLFILHFGLALDRVNPADLPALFARIPESFFSLHLGFNLKQIIVEFCDDAVVRFSLASGFRLRTDYAAFYGRHGLPPPGCRPYRLGVTREEAAESPGAYISRLFPFQRPQFCFTHGEQQLLQRALQGDTDAEASGALCIAVPTVKTRWRTIYDRVGARTPGLLPAGGVGRAARGSEKRRLLLNYLRQHPEELRPF
ncbi:MAG: hypothetical protein M3Y28_11755 [Armatimonadota bacterium]|nr:hypothetical protein [Armatimonadota bacterium]